MINDKYINLLNDIFKEETIKKYQTEKYKNYPFYKFFKIPVTDNNINSFRIVKNKDNEWFENKDRKERFFCEDINNFNGLIGETRAYSYLLKAGFNIMPHYTKSGKMFDFIARCKNDKDIEIEVHTPQTNKDELKKINNIRNSSKKLDATFFMPYGGIDEYNNSSTEHAIYKLSQIKSGYKQFSNKNNIKILWIDVQSKHIDILKPEYVIPIRTDRENIFSGAIWYAFWGTFGLPIFHGEHKIEHSCMKHYGIFLQQNAPDYAILSFKEKTILLENCYSENKISYATLLNDFFKLPNFSLQYSYLNFGGENLKQRIANELFYIRTFKHKYDNFS